MSAINSSLWFVSLERYHTYGSNRLWDNSFMVVKKRIDYKLRNLDTIEDVQIALEKLSHDLAADKLYSVTSFNHTYLVITRKVRTSARKSAFQYPEFLSQFDTAFANYYFNALERFISDKPIASAWNEAFVKANSKKVSNFVAMALGVNAHVNNDIALVLRDCNAQTKHYDDYVQINSIIISALNEIIDSLPNDKYYYGPKNKFFRPIYKYFMKLLIVRWRKQAWVNYIKLRNNIDYENEIEARAGSLARLLSKLPI